MNDIKQQKDKAKRTLRLFRKVHRISSLAMAVFVLIMASSGLMLGWKKNSGGHFLPATMEGTTSDLADWLPLDSLYTLACTYLHDSVSADLSIDLDRIDVRKDRGIVKFVFKEQYYDLQLDGATGELLQAERRWSDQIEDIHDGSILDDYFQTSGEPLKLIYTSLIGLSLLLFTITGLWLWYGPKRINKLKKRKKTGLADGDLTA